MAVGYITLINSTSTLLKRFRVSSAGYKPVKEKLGVRCITITGKIDNQTGPIVSRWQYTLQVYETDPTDPNKTDGDTEGYGTLAHLKTFFDYNYPGGTPSNVITFTEHNGTSSHQVYLTGTLSERNLTPMLEGVNAVFHVPITMMETTAE